LNRAVIVDQNLASLQWVVGVVGALAVEAVFWTTNNCRGIGASGMGIEDRRGAVHFSSAGLAQQCDSLREVWEDWEGRPVVAWEIDSDRQRKDVDIRCPARNLSWNHHRRDTVHYADHADLMMTGHKAWD
jgi:hypothetical protein